MKKPFDAPFFNGLFELHGRTAALAGISPDEFPRPFKALCGFGQLIMRVVMLAQPSFGVAAVTAVISSCRFALDDVDGK